MTNAELAILGLVGESSRHGYEIEQVIEARGMREWTEVGFSSIYYLLKKLEKANWVESELIPIQGRGKARRVYRITASGRDALLAATLDALSHPQQTYPAVLLGVANLPFLNSDQAQNAFASYLAEVEIRLGHISAQLAAQSPLPRHVRYLFDYSLAMLEAEKNWAKKIIQEMEIKNVEN